MMFKTINFQKLKKYKYHILITLIVCATAIIYIWQSSYAANNTAFYMKRYNTSSFWPETIYNIRDNIIEVHFVNMTESNINARYNNAPIKVDMSLNNNGEVLSWLESNVFDKSEYIMYVASSGITYFPENSSGMFDNFTNLSIIDFLNINTANVTNMANMFKNCSSLTSLDLSSFNTNSATNMANMFANCDNLFNRRDNYIKASDFGFIKVLAKQLHFNNNVIYYNKDGSVKTSNNFNYGDYYTVNNVRHDVVINGDVDGDSELSIQDIMKIAYYVFRDESSLNGKSIFAADFNNDNEWDLVDIMKLARKIYASDATTYTATFKTNGATSVSKEKITCEVIDGKCLITIPSAQRSNGTIIGYNTNQNEKSALYVTGQQVNLKKDMVFYVISSAQYNLQVGGSDLDYFSHRNTSCTVYNQESSCSIILPFHSRMGYEERGYSTASNASSAKYYPNELFNLTSTNTILYPVIANATHGKVIDVGSTKYYDNMVVEVENGCSESVYNNYLTYLQKINDEKSFLTNIWNKIFILTSDTFDSVWGSRYAARNFGSVKVRMIDVRCVNYSNYGNYSSLVHEMGHSWDFNYWNYAGKYINEQTDVVALFNKYKDMSGRPFRDYSYETITEFVADMVAYYYLKYIDPTSGYSNLSYPSDIKEVLEKYMYY